MNYKLDSGKLIVLARSSVHDTTTTWDRVSGTIDADLATLATAGAAAAFTFDMTRFETGDWLKNRKLRGDYKLDAHPTATFTLGKVSDVVVEGTGFTASGEGVLRWRGKEVVLVVTGRGTLDAACVTATAKFELDLKRLGLEGPKLLMFKVDDVVSVEVSLRGSPAA